MPLLTEKFYKDTQTQKTRVYVETGSHIGKGLMHVMESYDEIHSIELSLKFYHYCEVNFMLVPHVHMHHGNSKYVLPMLLAKIKEPVTVFLDGHFLGGDSAFGDEEKEGISSCPLEGEMLALLNRPYDDIIIDDCRCIGNKGIINEGHGNSVYPEYEYDWTDITEDTIRDLMKPGYEIYKNTHGEYSDGPLDQWILAKKPITTSKKKKS
jgi:hypothetical protein